MIKKKTIIEYKFYKQVFIVKLYIYGAYTMRHVWIVIIAFLHDFFDKSFFFFFANLIENKSMFYVLLRSFSMYSFIVRGFLNLWGDKTSSLIDMNFHFIIQHIGSSFAFFTIRIYITLGFIICVHFFHPFLWVTKFHFSLSQFLDELGLSR